MLHPQLLTSLKTTSELYTLIGHRITSSYHYDLLSVINCNALISCWNSNSRSPLAESHLEKLASIVEFGKFKVQKELKNNVTRG
jgi:hypothetical protein